MRQKPAEFDQIVAEMIEKCVAPSAQSGLDGEALVAFAENKLASTLGPATDDFCKWVNESSGGTVPQASERATILRQTAELIAQKALQRRLD